MASRALLARAGRPLIRRSMSSVKRTDGVSPHAHSLLASTHISGISNHFSSASSGRDPEPGVILSHRGAEETSLGNDAMSAVSSTVEAQDTSLNWPSPADGIVALLDSLHTSSGLPWWLTITVAAIVMRALLVPLKIVELKKLAQLKSLSPRLQLHALVQGMRHGKFYEEYRKLKGRQHELNSPSLLWMIGPGILVQIPLFLTTIYAVRRMALEHYSGFDVGGALWFKDLTVPGDGIVGALLPLFVAAAYLANVHVSLQGHLAMQGMYGMLEKIWKRLLQFSSVLVFISLYQLPQAVLMLSMPHSLMTLGQTVLLKKHQFVAFLIGTEAANMLKKDAKKVENLRSYEKLLKDAGMNFSSGKHQEAIHVLENAIKEEPDKEEAYALLGWVYNQSKDWINSATYYNHAISKGKTDEFKIAAYAGGGLALLKQGKTMECVELLKGVRKYQAPTNAAALQSYCSCLLLLSRALADAGLEDDAKEVMAQLRAVAPQKPV